MIIACVVRDGIDPLSLGITPEDFCTTDCARFFAVLCDRATRDLPNDAVSLKHRTPVEDAVLLKAVSVEEGAYVSQLPHYVSELRDLSARRELVEHCYRVIRRACEPEAMAGEVRGELLALVTSVEDPDTAGYVVGSELKPPFVERMDRRRAGEEFGISSGIADLDKITGGFRGGQLIVVAGRSAMGKSITACTFARAAIEQGHKTLLASFEFRLDELTDRLVAMTSGVPLSKLQAGTFDEDVERALDRLTDDLVIIDRPDSVDRFVAKAKALKAKFDIGFVVVDPLTDLKCRRGETREQEVGEIVRALKDLAQDIDAPVIAVSQLNRAVEQRATSRNVSPRPRVSDLRESGQIEQKADEVLLLYRREYYYSQIPKGDRTDTQQQHYENTRGLCEINVAKCRQGPNGICTVRFDGACARLLSLETEKAEQYEEYVQETIEREDDPF